MSKGIIVVDMPIRCYGCECCITKQYQHSINGDHYCGVTERKVQDYWDHEPSLKPDWCPIKETPVRLEELKFPYSINEYQRKGFSRGWNKCIDEIESIGYKGEMR